MNLRAGFRNYKQVKGFGRLRGKVGVGGWDILESQNFSSRKNLPVSLAICLPISIIISLQRLA
jgi:hypothetical protein